jgi:hypothetical protein
VIFIFFFVVFLAIVIFFVFAIAPRATLFVAAIGMAAFGRNGYNFLVLGLLIMCFNFRAKV